NVWAEGWHLGLRPEAKRLWIADIQTQVVGRHVFGGAEWLGQVGPHARVTGTVHGMAHHAMLSIYGPPQAHRTFGGKVRRRHHGRIALLYTTHTSNAGNLIGPLLGYDAARGRVGPYQVERSGATIGV